ncbi:adenylate/guanylate cyclase domain-containing protein [Candidatus Magnetaquicoccus inordinatus]|uniref:adenylate/guanylate cyclase domain-containing protein n=1 Tax=Candidatus Magnetaquicoccus inordinatus TaxID=2496818 RepID=UPI00102C6727|nr:adenylate/guanylate cyclase domain-containing protein [Candidatus Magnetaquicoccus inordinatus]
MMSETNEQEEFAKPAATLAEELPADEEDLFFADEEEEQEASAASAESAAWKILIVDDEESVHVVTRLALEGAKVEGQALRFLSARSRAEALAVLADNPDIALILLDVVMEEDDSGLQVVRAIRDQMHNHLVRIILRTGQPGMAPEKEMVLKYQINDYKEKNDLTYQKLFTTVVSSLRSYQDLVRLDHSNAQLRDESEKLRQALDRLERKSQAIECFVPKNFLTYIGRDGIEDVHYGDAVAKTMSVFFSDIRDFTSLSECMTHVENFNFINNYLTFVAPMIQKHGGFIDKFIGDCIMALFPLDLSQWHNGSVDAAIEMSQILKVYNQYRHKSGYKPIRVGVGIHAGPVYLGTVGFEKRMDTTAVGDTVNLASRLETLTKYYGITIAISQPSYELLDKSKGYCLREIDTVRVKGKSEAVTVWEVVEGSNEQRQEQIRRFLPQYQEALHWYKTQEWSLAEAVFADLYREMPSDQVSRIYLERCRRLQQERPGANWDGVSQV